MTVRVTIELIPKGIGEPKRLGTIDIINDRTGDRSRGNYTARMYDRGGRLWRTVRVEGFPRRQLLGFDLVFRVLDKAIGERNRRS